MVHFEWKNSPGSRPDPTEPAVDATASSPAAFNPATTTTLGAVENEIHRAPTSPVPPHLPRWSLALGPHMTVMFPQRITTSCINFVANVNLRTKPRRLYRETARPLRIIWVARFPARRLGVIPRLPEKHFLLSEMQSAHAPEIEIAKKRAHARCESPSTALDSVGANISARTADLCGSTLRVGLTE